MNISSCKLFVLNILLAVLFGFNFSNVNAYLGPVGEAAILGKCSLKEGEIKESLDKFFENKLVKEVFIDRKKIFLLGWMAQNIQSNDSKKKRMLNLSAAFYDFQQNYLEEIQEIKSTYKVEIDIHGNKTFLISGLEPDYLIKIPFANVPLIGDPGNDIYQYFNSTNEKYSKKTSKKLTDPYFDEAVSKYQNISRVFYNEKINDFAREKKFKHIKCLKEYLYRLPDKSEIVIDDNYVVVQEKVSADQIPFVKFMNACCYYVPNQGEDFGLLEQFRELTVELCEVIKYAALWDVTPENVFLFMEGETLKVAFVGAVRPAFTGSEERYFFQKNEAEIASNIDNGFKSFAESIGMKHEDLLRFTNHVFSISHDYLLNHANPKIKKLYTDLDLS